MVNGQILRTGRPRGSHGQGKGMPAADGNSDISVDAASEEEQFRGARFNTRHNQLIFASPGPTEIPSTQSGRPRGTWFHSREKES